MSSNADVQDRPGNASGSEDIASGSERNGNDQEPVRSPLSPEEFRSVLEAIDKLGLTWTADVPPLLRSKTKAQKESFPTKQVSEIQNKYPAFPRELGNVIFYTLTGSDVMRSMIGAEDADHKAQIARELVIGKRPDFSSEFFFKYAIKVPYFVDLDWEVVIKAFERNVREVPRIPYALLSLIFRQSISPRFLIGADTESVERDTLTVAVDEHLIEKLIDSLTEAKKALEKAGRLAQDLDEKVLKTEKES